MYNKIIPSVSITIMIGSLSSVATFNMLSYILPQEAIGRTSAQRNDNGNEILMYENSTYGMRMQCPSDWHKEENVSSGSDNNVSRILQIQPLKVLT